MNRPEKLSFTGHSGAALAARLDLPRRPRRAVALFAHCFTCSKDILAARRIAARLAAEGIAVLRFDFTGLGHSEGEFAHTGFSANVGDLVAAATHLAGRGMAPDVLIGHSLGGAAVIAAAGQIPSVRAVATINAPADPGHVLKHLGTGLERIEQDGEAEVTIAGRSFTVSAGFVRDVAGARLQEALRGLGRALLVLHAPLDATVGIENATEIFMAARHPKSFVTLDTADHMLSKPEDAEYAAGVIAAWATRYLQLPPESREGAPEGVVRVIEADPGGFLQDIAAGPSHRLVADEPPSLGGTDQGPTPYQLVSAGLGACTAMTLRMYARRKRLPLEHVEVDVMHDKQHAADMDEADGKAPKIDVFQRRIRLEGPLEPADRQRLLEIAERCPVHRTLEASSRIETALAE